MIRLNLDRLRELTEIFKHRWDPIILVLLAERPRRRKELTQEVRDNREHISDGVLSEVLDRLQDEGLVFREERGPRHVVYWATPATLRRVERLRRISGDDTGDEAPDDEAPDDEAPDD